MNGIEQDEKAQKNGIVCLLLNMEALLGINNSEMEWLTRWQNRVMNSLPMRSAGVHCCFEDLQQNPIAIFQATLNLFTRARFRVHRGRSFLVPGFTHCCPSCHDRYPCFWYPVKTNHPLNGSFFIIQVQQSS